MNRLRTLQCTLAFLVAGPLGAASIDSQAGESGWHLVSLVFGCVEVPNNLHSFKITDLRDAFSGTIAASAEDRALVNWSSGMWDFKSVLKGFEPNEPPSDGAERRREGIWRARRGESEFLVLRQGWSVLFGEVRKEADAVELRKVFSSYRHGSEACANAEKPFASTE